MTKFSAVFLLFFTCFFVQAQDDWPILSQTAQHNIVGTIGEERGTRTRFHKGADVSAAAGTSVYAIQTGTARSSGNTVWIGNHVYVHLKNVIPDGTMITTLPTKIGETDANAHVHLQRSATVSLSKNPLFR